jgi:hypothetical protein
MPQAKRLRHNTFGSLNPAVRYGSDKAGQVGSTPAASTRIKMRLWQSGFMHPVSTGNYGGSNPPGRASARSFNGRTLDFGPNYECSIHSLAAKFWCGVIQRQDGLLIRAPPGFDSQRRNHAL